MKTLTALQCSANAPKLQPADAADEFLNLQDAAAKIVTVLISSRSARL